MGDMMAITRNQVIAIFSQIITPEMRTVIRRGIENGLATYDTLDVNNRKELGDYSENTQMRNLFSSICAKLQQAITESYCGLKACSHKKTSTTYIEIEAANLIMHLRNEASGLPQYAKDKLSYNTTFALGKTNYIQLAYKATKGEVLEEVSYLVMDIDENEVYREVIKGNWNEEPCYA